MDEQPGGTGGGRDPDEKASLRWAWAAGLAIPLATFVVLAGAVLATPGDPFSCRLPNPRAWRFCPWTRAFVDNATTGAVLLSAAVTLLAAPVGVARAMWRQR